MALVLSGDGAVGPLSATEVGYLDGVTSTVQTQINSKLTTPGAWTSYTPSWTNITVGNGTVTAKYMAVGKTVSFMINFTLGSTSSIGSLASVTLPVTAASGSYVFNGWAGDAGTQDYILAVRSSGSSANIYAVGAGSANATVIFTSSTVPFTWGSNDYLLISGTYEAA